MERSRILPLENPIRNYDWGSRTAIAELRGEASPAELPQAEMWMGAHPSAPSRIVIDGEDMSLDAWIARDPEAVLGADVAQRFGGQLPFLFKVLAAEHPLSIQTHPSLARARRGFERENAQRIALDAPHRSYRDANHKPELLCALSRFEALNGFRPIGEILERFAQLAAPDLAPALDALAQAPDALDRFFAALMQLPKAAAERVLEAAARLCTREEDADLAWVARLAAAYPGDLGALAPLYLNRVTLSPGEALFLPAGRMHSYLRGLGVELMANSDNVLRGGLTSKHIDVPELLDTLHFDTGPPERLRARPVGPAERLYDTPAAEFELRSIRLEPAEGFQARSAHGVEILLCTRGQGHIDTGDAELPLRPGGAVLVPACAPAYRIAAASEAPLELHSAGVPAAS